MIELILKNKYMIVNGNIIEAVNQSRVILAEKIDITKSTSIHYLNLAYHPTICIGIVCYKCGCLICHYINDMMFYWKHIRINCSRRKMDIFIDSIRIEKHDYNNYPYHDTRNGCKSLDDLHFYIHLSVGEIIQVSTMKKIYFLINIRNLVLQDRCKELTEIVSEIWLCKYAPLWAFMMVCQLVFE